MATHTSPAPRTASVADRAWASLGASLGLVVPPAVHSALETFGPASRVLFRAYVPVVPIAQVLVMSLVGLSVGVEAGALLRPQRPRYRVLRMAAGCLLGGLAGLIASLFVDVAVHTRPWATPAVRFSALVAIVVAMAWGGAALAFAPGVAGRPRRLPWLRLGALALCFAWIASFPLRTFPASGTAAEREAWARANVREYGGLARIVASVPVVAQDAGQVRTVAPTAGDRHAWAPEMDGDALLFSLDVIGDRGAGVFDVDATLSGGHVFRWRAGRWRFQGRTTPVDLREEGP